MEDKEPRSTRNPLSVKVTRLLSANVDDAGTRAALETLGELEGEEGGVALSELLGPGGLKKEIDQRLLQVSLQFLDDFSLVNEQLCLLQGHLDEMHDSCSEVEQALETARSGTRYLVEHAEGLRQKRADTQLQQQLVRVFLARFMLSEAEIRALTSREVPVGNEVFAAMDRIARIREDCEVLLSAENEEDTRAGADIMETTAQHLEAGYEKLLRWCSFQARSLSKETLEVSSTMKKAILRLQARPTLLQDVLDLLGSTRSQAILNAFIEALTRGGPNGLPRPIELHAHDPLRYIGDMMAWIHQTTAGEREFLESLFSIKTDGRWIGSVREWSENNESDQWVRRLIDKDLEGCARPLRLRINQTIKSQESALVLFRIATLVQFYKVTMEHTVGKEAHLSKILAQILADAYAAFRATLVSQGKTLLRYIPTPADDLSPPSSLIDVLASLKEIALVYESSVMDDVQYAPVAETQSFKDVLDLVLDPAVEMCKTMIKEKPERERDIFGVNCSETIVHVLEKHDFCKDKMKTMQDERAAYIESLTSEHFNHLLRESGLERVQGRLESSEPADIEKAASDFFKFLSTLDPLSSPRLSLLSTRNASSIHLAALQRLGASYFALYDYTKNRNLSIALGSKEEVATLLGISSV